MGSLRLPEDLTPPGLFQDLDVSDAVSPGRQQPGRQRGRKEGRKEGRKRLSPRPVKTRPGEVDADVSGLSSINSRPSLFNWGALAGSWRGSVLKEMVYDRELNNVETDSRPS